MGSQFSIARFFQLIHQRGKFVTHPQRPIMTIGEFFFYLHLMILLGHDVVFLSFILLFMFLKFANIFTSRKFWCKG